MQFHPPGLLIRDSGKNSIDIFTKTLEDLLTFNTRNLLSAFNVADYNNPRYTRL